MKCLVLSDIHPDMWFGFCDKSYKESSIDPPEELVMKTMDVSYGLKQLWVRDYVIRVAQETGFELKDKFILIANKRPLHKGMQQHFARKHHSYFFVFRKQ